MPCTYRQDPGLECCNNFFDLNSSIVKTNVCLSVKKPKRGTQIFPTIPYSNFGLTGTSNFPLVLNPYWVVHLIKKPETESPPSSTLNQQTTCVGGYQPDVCHDNKVAGVLKVHTELTNYLPLSGLGTSNFCSEHKICTNDDDTSGSITSLLSDGAGLDLDNDLVKHCQMEAIRY